VKYPLARLKNLLVCKPRYVLDEQVNIEGENELIRCDESIFWERVYLKTKIYCQHTSAPLICSRSFEHLTNYLLVYSFFRETLGNIDLMTSSEGFGVTV